MYQKGRKNTLIVESLNVRGIREEKGKKKKQIADDMQTYKIAIMRIQEHHLKGTGVIEIRIADNKDMHELSYTWSNDNKHYGVRIIVRKDLKADYKEITGKNCIATVKLEKQNRIHNFISIYTPTLGSPWKVENIRKNLWGAQLYSK